MSDKRINSITTSNYSIAPELSHYDTKARVKFSGSCIKQDRATYNHGTIVNIYIVYEISKNFNISSDLSLENCLFRTPLCLGNISKDFSVDNMKKTGLNGYVYDFSVDYDAIAVDNILGIHKYLMEKNGI